MAATTVPATITVRRPFDGGVHGQLAATTADQVRIAVSTARVAQAEWADTPARQRTAVFRRLAALILRDRDRILDSIQDESGKAQYRSVKDVRCSLGACQGRGGGSRSRSVGCRIWCRWVC